MSNKEERKPIYGKLTVICMKGCEEIADKIDWYLKNSEKTEKLQIPTLQKSSAPASAQARQNACLTKLSAEMMYLSSVMSSTTV